MFKKIVATFMLTVACFALPTKDAAAALVWADKVMETTTTTGTGALTLGGAVSGYQSFGSGIGNSNTCYYAIKGQTGTEWETGFGTLNSSSTTLTRTTVFASSNGGSAVNLSAGTKYVFVDYISKAIGRLGYSATPSNGMIPIGNGTDFSFATFTAGSGISISNGSGTVTISATSANPSGYLFGMELTYASTTTFTVSTGKCRDGTDAADITCSSALTKSTSAWAVGSGNGGLDTGSIATSTWYHVYSIKKDSDGSYDCLFSTSATSPTMPSGYTYFRRIGSLKTNGSSQWTQWYQNGNNFYWNAPVLDVNATNPGTSAVTRTLSVPTGVKVKAIMYAGWLYTTTGTNGLITSLDTADTTPTNSMCNFQASGGINNGGVIETMTNTSAQVRSRVSNSGAGDILNIITYGWVDYRGTGVVSGLYGIGTSVLPQGYINNLEMSYATTTTFTVAAGKARDSSDTTDINSTSAITKSTSAWAAGSSSGGLDTGTIANSTWYHVYIIRKDVDASADVLFSTNATSPTMPSGYTYKRRIGSLLTNGSAQWTKWYQNGNTFLWDVPVRDFNVANPGTSAALKTFSVPTGVKVGPIGGGFLYNGTNNLNLIITSPDQTDTAPSATNKTAQSYITVAGSYDSNYYLAGYDIWTNTSAQLRYRLDVSGTNDAYDFVTRGWVDLRGAVNSQSYSTTLTGTHCAFVNNFRLSLESGVSVSTSNQSNKTTIYCTPHNGTSMATYDSSTWTLHSSSEFSVSLGTLTSDKNYDVFCYWSGTVLTLEFSAAWTSDTARNDAIAAQDGVWVKSSDHSRRYLGTFRTTSTTQTQDTDSQRYLWNVSNRFERFAKGIDTTNSWTYTTATWRAANSNTTDGVGRFSYVMGLSEDPITVNRWAFVNNSGAPWTGAGIGIDSTSANSATSNNPIIALSSGMPLSSSYTGHPGIGYHYIQALEISGATSTSTWYGDDSSGAGAVSSTLLQTGVFGRIKG